MKESMIDIMERMESLVPEYSYSSVENIVETDKKIREFLLAKMKEIKDYMFHVVQVSYELQRDKLTEAAEDAWDDIDSLTDRIENSRTTDLASNKTYCEECKKRIENNLQNLVRRDRELVVAVKDMRRTAHLLYKALLERGKERHFIKNLDKIKKYKDEVNSLLDAREKGIMGG